MSEYGGFIDPDADQSPEYSRYLAEAPQREE
jgi:hypothetical protein